MPLKWKSAFRNPTHLLRTEDMAQTLRGMTDAERFAHYGELATQFREWAKTETNEEARAGLLDMAR
jgi:hypothetical protein